MDADSTRLDAPEWFVRALGTPGQSHFVEVEGCPIHYLTWGDPALPGLLFVGASGGHAHWYDHIAPLMTDQFQIAALDLSGCGDSGRRETYTQGFVVKEIAAVVADCGMIGRAMPPVLVGHSAGAQGAVRAAQAFGRDYLGVIAVDGLRYARLETDTAFKALTGTRPPPRAPKVHERLEDAVERFRITPPPRIEIGNDFIVRHIAGHSFREVEGGWSSKFDTSQTMAIDLALELTGALKDLPCQAASLYGHHSHLTDETAGVAVTDMNEGQITSFIIPGSSHFPQIDNPFAFVSAIKGVALTWMAQRHRETRP